MSEPKGSLLPANSSPLEKALDMGFGQLLDRVMPPFPALMNPLLTPVDFLPYLAADRGVTEWSSSAPEAEKRGTVKLAWPIARQSGTRKALENAATGLQLVPQVRSWYEQTPIGAPYSFSVRAFTSLAYSEEMDARLDQRLAAAKSERDILSVSVGLSAFGTHSIAAATVCGELTIVHPIVIDGLKAAGNAFSAAGLYSVETLTIYPQRF
ncbi:phage tail protein I [Pseudomonas yamanorum]|uniref:Phage tail protein I n=1 Tax=Pseudomonas yamanorum TaxID=515393 RepID=A0A7Y8K6Y0_9PSED|nr:phage tail protein I [Pseudomonas yamanorum]NWD26024.1 phage tail protein I [Pseudomonas yamanorum]NWE16976.1 phage tail protein I [Pseudomonas yamanorum]NWE42855.1 phage tail protein I [Pseudomonas yamanorum]NWE78508.1 phage tail protein I [Pseudomonas yamanorum]